MAGLRSQIEQLKRNLGNQGRAWSAVGVYMDADRPSLCAHCYSLQHIDGYTFTLVSGNGQCSQSPSGSRQ